MGIPQNSKHHAHGPTKTCLSLLRRSYLTLFFFLLALDLIPSNRPRQPQKPYPCFFVCIIESRIRFLRIHKSSRSQRLFASFDSWTPCERVVMELPGSQRSDTDCCSSKWKLIRPKWTRKGRRAIETKNYISTLSNSPPPPTGLNW